MKKIIPFLVFFLFIATLISASPVPPYTINGKASLITGECIGNFDIDLKTFSMNTYQYETITIKVNDNCEFMYNLGQDNTPFPAWNEGMEVTLTFCKVSINPDCEVSIKIGEGGCESGGGCAVDFVLQPSDIVYIDGEEKEAAEVILIECWDGSLVSDTSECPEEEPEPVLIIDPWVVGIVLIVVVGLGVIWSWIKNTDLRYKYRWIPGMAGILNHKLKIYQQTTNRTEAKKLKETLLKYSKTLTEKYLNTLKRG